MKIRTFLQIVPSGKITASQKANLSINKKIVIHEFKICIEHYLLLRLIGKYFQPKVLWQNWIYWKLRRSLPTLPHPSWLSFFNWDVLYTYREQDQLLLFFLQKTSLPKTWGRNWKTYWQTWQLLVVDLFVWSRNQSHRVRPQYLLEGEDKSAKFIPKINK